MTAPASRSGVGLLDGYGDVGLYLTKTLLILADVPNDGQLARLVKAAIEWGVIVQMGDGVYARAKRSVLTGEPIPQAPLEVLADEYFAAIGLPVMPSRLTEDYNNGISTQVLAGVVVRVMNGDKRRPKFGFNGKFVEYEEDAPTA